MFKLSYENFVLIMQRSSTASKLGIDNTIPSNRVFTENLKSLYEAFLLISDSANLVHESIYITSGYRCPRLNKAVGGIPHSMHTKCAAFDFAFKNCVSKSDFVSIIDVFKAEYLSRLMMFYGISYEESLSFFKNHFILYPDRLFVHFQLSSFE